MEAAECAGGVRDTGLEREADGRRVSLAESLIPHTLGSHWRVKLEDDMITLGF